METFISFAIEKRSRGLHIINTRPIGGVDAPPPQMSFLELLPNRQAYRADILCSI